MRYADLVVAPYNARLALKTAPVLEPVTVADLQMHSRIDNGAEQQYLLALITASRQWIEQYLGRQLITATWTLTLDEFPLDGVLEVPRPPLVSVSNVKYLDADRVLQTVAITDYYVHTFAGPEAPAGRIEKADGVSWPSVFGGEGAVQVEYVAGYGANPSDVPLQIRQALLLHAAEMYERREQLVVGVAAAPVSITSERLLWPLRVF